MNSSDKFFPINYQSPVPGEEIIRSSPSTGFAGVFDCDYFYKRYASERDMFKGNYHHKLKPSFEDPWIVLKSIPEAEIINRHLVISREKRILYGLQYHYLTQPNTKNLKEMFDIDYYINFELPHPTDNKLNQKVIYSVAKESESFDEAFFLGETDNFGHWIFEFTPKLLWYKKYLLDANINVPILVGEDVPNRWLEVNEPLGIPAKNFHRVKLGKTLKVKKLYICGPSVSKSLDFKSSFVRADDISELRVIFRNYYKLDLIPKTVDILFESRERARWRKIVNEDELIKRVKDEVGLTTEKFFPEAMTFREQIEKLQSSKIFVGTGASLPFSFFMSKDSVLVEIRNPGGSGFATNITSDIFRIPWYRPTVTMTDNNTGPTDIDVDLKIDEFEFLRNLNAIKTNLLVKTV